MFANTKLAMHPTMLWAFGGVLALLIVASVTVTVLARVFPMRNFVEVKLRIQTWWWIVGVFVLAIGFNHHVAVVVMAIVSFMAFKEYLTLVPLRESDRPVLFWAYLAIPLHYLWVAINWYGMFLIFVPVYVFLFLPMRMVLIGETKGFLRAAGVLHWGLMTTVFSLSHMVYLLDLPVRTSITGYEVRGEMLLFFLAVVTQLNDVAQFLWGKAIGKHKVIPKVSPNKTVEGFLGGVITTVLLSVSLGPLLTPMTIQHSILAGVLLSVAGFIGDVVMSAVKRDIGVKDASTFLPGHGGILDRLDSLTFTAPLFFHFLYYYYY